MPMKMIISMVRADGASSVQSKEEGFMIEAEGFSTSNCYLILGYNLQVLRNIFMQHSCRTDIASCINCFSKTIWMNNSSIVRMLLLIISSLNNAPIGNLVWGHKADSSIQSELPKTS